MVSNQNLLAAPSDPSEEQRLVAIQEKMRKLERRDWWLWGMAVIVMLLLTFAVFTMSFPELTKLDDPLVQRGLDRAVRGLIGLVLIFNGYTIYQQRTIKRLRSEFSEKIDDMRLLQIRAAKFHQLATADPLTGLYNRRMAEQQLAAEASRSQRHGHPLTVVAVDLNDFKQINDTHGHAAGDEVLRVFATRLRSATRMSDFAARMGGDEFLLVLPECSISQVERMLARLRPMEVAYAENKIPVTFSAGWVGFERGETMQQFLERADQVLYREKRALKARTKEELPVT